MQARFAGEGDKVQKATPDDWIRYYREGERRSRSRGGDPVPVLRARAILRDRLSLAAGVVALAGVLTAYVTILGH
jgi:hypothetical protein